MIRERVRAGIARAKADKKKHLSSLSWRSAYVRPWRSREGPAFG